MKINFKVLSTSEFHQRYPSVDVEDETLEDMGVRSDSKFAEVDVPGYGWHAALEQGGAPVVFYTDDGWCRVPQNEGLTYVQIP